MSIGTQRECIVARPLSDAIARTVVSSEADGIKYDDIAITRRSCTGRPRATGQRPGSLDGHVAIIKRIRQNTRVDIDAVGIAPDTEIADRNIVRVQQPVARRTMGCGSMD